MTSVGLSLAAAMVAAATFASPEVTHFPGDFFDTLAKPHLQRRAMESWPGPRQIVDLWQAGELRGRDKVAVLLGMAASHDPVLLPLYREAVVSRHPNLRQAAAYGYRDLLGDVLPNVTAGVDLETGKLMAQEIDLVHRTLRQRPLVEFWLQAVLMTEGATMPGWRGVVLERPTGVSFGALEEIVSFEDFRYLATAWRVAEQPPSRFGLMRLLEAVTLQEFFDRPTDGRTGWGTRNVNEAFEAADAFVDLWLDHHCATDPERVLASAASRIGDFSVHPLDPSSWYFWTDVLKQGPPPWRMMATRMLYRFGGRWADLSLFRAESAQQQKLYDELILWYRLAPAHILKRKDQPPS